MTQPLYPKLAQFMQSKFIEYRKQNGFMKSQTEFAGWIGISQANMNRYINGMQCPSMPNVIVLAEKLGPEIYDVLDLQRPLPNDEMLQEMVKDWDLLNIDQKESIFKNFQMFRDDQEE